MTISRTRSPIRRAAVGFLVAATVSLLIGLVGYGDPLREAVVPAIGTGIGVAIAIYVYDAVIAGPVDD